MYALSRHQYPLASLLVRLLLILCTLSLCSCAGRSQPSVPSDPAAASARWQQYQSHASAAAAPYRLSMSMRFGKEGDTRRVTALFWGNGDDSVRLDVMAGVGATVACIAQEKTSFLLYAPMENKAYFYEGSRSPLIKAGVPLPLTLFDLSAILCGRSAQVFGTGFASAVSAPAGGITFGLTAGPKGLLTVGPDGLPVKWSDGTWTMSFSHDDAGSLSRLDVASIKGDRGILIIKERMQQAQPFTQDQMALSLPSGCPVLPLEARLHR